MSESLRDQLSAALDKVEAEAPAAEPAPQVETPAVTHEVADNKPADAAPPAELDKPGRTAGRARDEQGRLLPGKADPVAKAPPVETQPVVPEVKRPARPSSWKKDYWDHWEKLDPKLAEYINQRESEYAKGVSTYKTEWERAKPLLDAVAPHQQLFQQHGIDPAQQIGKYIEIHKGLAMGSPEQKLGMLMRIAQDYQIPLQNLFVQQNGQVYLNPQVQPHQPAQQQQAPDFDRLIEEKLAAKQAALDVHQMEKDTQKYPHLATVRETMKGLLLSGLANDLPSAYEAALRMPAHSDIFDAIQEQKRTADETERKQAEAKRVAAAKAAAVSVKGSTPTGAPAGGKKGLRSAYEESLSDVEGRV